jgi:uncharacterized membrane protein YkvA (DUF1232 family)
MTTFESDEFSDKNFKSFMHKFGAKMTKSLVFTATLTYCVITDEKTPKADVLLLAGSIAYFLLPVDLIPDAILIAGWTDDIVVLKEALKRVAKSIRPNHYLQARTLISEWGI